MRIRIAVAAALAATGCSTPPQQPADTTPENPTAVFETTVSSTGIAGLFPFESTEKRYVRPNMRREEHATKGTGTFSGFLVTRLAGPGDALIARLDRKVLWTLNNGRKEYTECPVHGCPAPAAKQAPQKPEPKREEPRQKTEEGCVARIASSKFDVTPTGQKRALNGFSTEEYQAAWVVRIVDRQKRSSTSTLKFDVWTTPMNAQMRQAFDTEAAFNRAYAAGAAAAGPKPGPQQVMPPQMMAMMTSYLHNLSPADRARFARAAHELEKIKGHPVSTKMEWFVDGNACGAKQDEQPAAASPGAGMGGLISGLAGKLAKKEESGPQPLLSFTVEVKQLGVQPVRDSVFLVPAGYKLLK